MKSRKRTHIVRPFKVNLRDSAYQIEFAVQIPKIRGHVPRSAPRSRARIAFGFLTYRGKKFRPSGGTFGRLWNGLRSVPACRRNCSFATAATTRTTGFVRVVFFYSLSACCSLYIAICSASHTSRSRTPARPSTWWRNSCRRTFRISSVSSSSSIWRYARLNDP